MLNPVTDPSGICSPHCSEYMTAMTAVVRRSLARLADVGPM